MIKEVSRKIFRKLYMISIIIQLGFKLLFVPQLLKPKLNKKKTLFQINEVTHDAIYLAYDK